jgi:hypothetical protein
MLIKHFIAAGKTACSDDNGVCPCGYDGKRVINCKYETMTLDEAQLHINDSCVVSRDIAIAILRLID